MRYFKDYLILTYDKDSQIRVFALGPDEYIPPPKVLEKKYFDLLEVTSYSEATAEYDGKDLSCLLVTCAGLEYTVLVKLETFVDHINEAIEWYDKRYLQKQECKCKVPQAV